MASTTTAAAADSSRSAAAVVASEAAANLPPLGEFAIASVVGAAVMVVLYWLVRTWVDRPIPYPAVVDPDRCVCSDRYRLANWATGGASALVIAAFLVAVLLHPGLGLVLLAAAVVSVFTGLRLYRQTDLAHLGARCCCPGQASPHEGGVS